MRSFVLVSCTILLTIVSLGCTSPAKEITTLLNNPTVQTTMEGWEADADATNPEVGFYLVSGGEIRTKGIIARARARGSQHGGIDPVLYRTLVEIAKERGYQPPAEPTTTTTNESPPAETPEEKAALDAESSM